MISNGKCFKNLLHQKNLYYINGSADQLSFKDNSIDIIFKKDSDKITLESDK